jgi:N-acetylglucosaminyl-diphospho-decaprenol L-rhamnosyltransferase
MVRPAYPPGSGRVTLVMVSYRSGPWLFQAIDRALGQPAVAQLVVVNNGNPPELERELRRRVARDPRIQLIEGQGNIGFAAACNRGVERATGELLLLLNPDCLLPPGGVAALLKESAEWPQPWLLGCRLVYPDGREQAGARRREPTPRRMLVEGLGLYRLAPEASWLERVNQHEEPLPARTVEVEVSSGACLLLPRADYQALGGMDEGYFLHVEDIDLCLRLRQAGGRVYFTPRVVAEHRKGASRASTAWVEWHKTRGLWRFLWDYRRRFRQPVASVAAAGGLLLRLLALVLGSVWSPRSRGSDAASGGAGQP